MHRLRTQRRHARLSEQEFTRQVLRLIADTGLLWHWCADARKCSGQPGFPDLMIAGRHGVVLAELKTQAATTTSSQDLWAYWLSLAGFPWHLWRPSDLESGRIREILQQIA